MKMDINYCPECGSKLDKDAVFCSKCGFKVKEDEIETKFCFNCGEKISVHAEICPKCGVRLMNPIANTASDALNKSQKKIGDSINSFSKYVTLQNLTIVILIIIIIALILSAPSIIEKATPYKEVGSSYIANPTPYEKVQFDAEYIGTTNWNGGLYFSYITNNDILKMDDEYIILQGEYTAHDLAGNEGKMVHLEGRFASSGVSTERMADGNIEGHWFGADKIEVLE